MLPSFLTLEFALFFTERLQNEKSRSKDALHEAEQIRQKEVRLSEIIFTKMENRIVL